MSQKLGFVVVRASKVVLRAQKEIDRIEAIRKQQSENYVLNTIDILNKSFFRKLFRRPAATREEALKYIEEDDFDRWEYYDLAYRMSDKEAGLKKLIDVGSELLKDSSVAEMELAIEVADWLVLKPE